MSLLLGFGVRVREIVRTLREAPPEGRNGHDMCWARVRVILRLEFACGSIGRIRYHP